MNPIVNRDPGDKCDVCNPPPLASYKALYQLGHAYFSRFFEAEDFSHAVEQAQDALAEGEQLVSAGLVLRDL